MTTDLVILNEFYQLGIDKSSFYNNFANKRTKVMLDN